ncbi:hypothetical protein JCM11251_006571 [Rhodosporidiobolus azoricus]
MSQHPARDDIFMQPPLSAFRSSHLMLRPDPPRDHTASPSIRQQRSSLPLPWQNDSNDSEEEFGNGGADCAEEEEVTPALVRIVTIAGLGGLLFGFDTGVVSGALVVIRDDLGGKPLTLGQESFLVTSALIGALFGSIAASRFADWKGRKPVILGAAALFTIGALEQAAAQVYKEVILGRVLVGLGVGLASMTLPVYLAEISPRAYRGRIVASLVVLITGGQVLAYAIDAAFFNVPHGWRWMFGLGAVPAVVQLLMGFTMPESPRFEIAQGKVASARRTLRLLHPKASGTEVQRKIEEIQAEVGEVKEDGQEVGSRFEQMGLLWRDKANRRALLVAAGLQAFQQLTGFNCLMYYSAKIIEQTHLSQPAAFACFVAVSNFLSTLVALRLIDRLGRRTLLLRTLIGMVVGMSVLAGSFALIPKTSRMSVGDAALGATAAGASPWAFVALAGMVVFCCAYALGLGNVAWVVQSEVFNQDLRALGNGIATASCWICNLIVSATFLHISKALTPSGAFGLYAFIAAGGWLFTWCYVPETKNLSLDEVRALFEREVGIGPGASPVRGGLGSVGGLRGGGRGGYHVLGGEEEASEEDEVRNARSREEEQ